MNDSSPTWSLRVAASVSPRWTIRRTRSSRRHPSSGRSAVRRQPPRRSRGSSRSSSRRSRPAATRPARLSPCRRRRSRRSFCTPPRTSDLPGPITTPATGWSRPRRPCASPEITPTTCARERSTTPRCRSTRPSRVTGDRYSYKVTLAWDDKRGNYTSPLALVNDLDLTVTDPNGVVYYPFDTLIAATGGAARFEEASLGAKSCTSSACQDRVNNVEQVVITNSGNPLPVGEWTITVNAHRLETSSQAFSLVLSPECPVRILDRHDPRGTGELPLRGPRARGRGHRRRPRRISTAPGKRSAEPAAPSPATTGGTRASGPTGTTSRSPPARSATSTSATSGRTRPAV